MKPKGNWKKIGEVCVDSGEIAIVDGYNWEAVKLRRDDIENGNGWEINESRAQLQRADGTIYTLGVISGTFYGDDNYQVFDTSPFGGTRPKALYIDFDPDEEDFEDED